MKTFVAILILSLFGISEVYSQSCVMQRVPSSASLPQSGGTTYAFSIINMNSSCTPVFAVSHSSWLSYRYERSNQPDRGLLYITATANAGPPRTGYVYVDNKESMKITISQAGSHVYVTGVSVSPSSAFLSVNETKYLAATVSPSNATIKAVTWTSSNPSIAAVDNYGKVTAGASSGKATITATSAENSYIKSSCVITVTTMPKSFSWGNYITPWKDQRTGDACFLFAAIGVVEAKYKIQHQTSTNIDLAEGQLNMVCLGTSISIPNALTFIKNHGVVDEDCYPYSRSYFGGGYAPFPDCYSPCGNNYALRVYIDNFTSLDLSTVDANLRADYFKSIIRSHGTIAVSFDGTSLHSGQMHAYEIYGWEESVWLYKDSWQGQAGYYRTSIDIPAVLATNKTGFSACYVGNVR